MCDHATTAVVEHTAAVADALTHALRTINARSFVNLMPTKATISTMTITASLNVRRVCRDSVMIALSLIEGDGPLRTSEKPAKRRRTSVFFNQVTIRHGTKSVKVFDNGSMHVTGCTSPTEFLTISSAVCALLGDVAGVETKDGTRVTVTGFDVQMINLNFGAGRQLFLRELRDKCAALGYTASYDADTYPGLNVKIPVANRRITVLIFKSGKIILTGAKTGEELERAHAAIMAVLDNVDTIDSTHDTTHG